MRTSSLFHFGAALISVAALWILNASGADRLHGFGPPSSWSTSVIPPEATVLAGDVTGDGLSDLVIFHRNGTTGGGPGDVTVMRSWEGSQFGVPAPWHDYFCIGNEVPLLGDFNGDRRMDIATFIRSTAGGSAEGDVYVALSTGSGFGPAAKWHDYFCVGNEVPLTGDVDGDGDDDIITLTRGSSAAVYVALSDRTSAFAGTGLLWHSSFCPGSAIPLAADVNGDGRADLLCFHRDARSGDVEVALSTAASFGAAGTWHDYFCAGDEIPLTADLNADGRADILTFTRGGSGDVYAAVSTGAAFQGSGVRWHDEAAFGMAVPLAGRFDGDLNADIAWIQNGVKVAVAGAHAVESGSLSEFNYGTLGVPWSHAPIASRPAVEERPLLVVLLQYPSLPAFPASRNLNYWEHLFFGPGQPNLVSYFRESSGGRFTFRRAGVIGPITSLTLPMPDGVDHRTRVIRAARDAGFDFRPYKGSDNIVDDKELVIAVVDNMTDGGGQNRAFPATVGYGILDLDQVTVTSALAAAGHRGAFDLYAHELSHSLGTLDFYSSGCFQSGLSLMHCNAGLSTDFPGGTVPHGFVHLDPWHKLALGWQQPRLFDVRNYPGSTVIRPPNHPLASAKPPLLFYDRSRSLNEYYILEARSQTVAGASSVMAGFPAGGYDAAVRDSGIVAWYAGMGADSVPRVVRSAMGPGADGVFQSTVWPGSDDIMRPMTMGPGWDAVLQTARAGDDVIIGDRIFPGPDGLLQTQTPAPGSDDGVWGIVIDPGPDGILQSEPNRIVLPGANGTLQTAVAGDDVRSGNTITRGPDNRLQSTGLGGDDMFSSDDAAGDDWTCYPSITPSSWYSRPACKVWKGADGAFRPEWWDRTPAATAFRAAQGTGGEGWLQWGLNFAPHVRPFFYPAMGTSFRAGTEFSLSGSFGVSSTAFRVRIVSAARSYELQRGSWTPGVIRVRLPNDVESGDYRLVLTAADSSELSSNSWKLRVRNPVNDWLLTVPDIGLLLAPKFIDPLSDPDFDHIPNIAEFVFGTHPGIADSPDAHVKTAWDPKKGMTLSWRVNPASIGEAEAIPQRSTDLKTWKDIPAKSYGKDQNGMEMMEANAEPDPAHPQCFVRLRMGMREEHQREDPNGIP